MGAGCAGEPVRLRCPTAVVARGLLQLCIPPWGHARCVRVARMSPPELNIIKYDFIIISIYVCPGSTDAPDQPTVTNLVRGMVQNAVDVDEVRVGAEA